MYRYKSQAEEAHAHKDGEATHERLPPRSTRRMAVRLNKFRQSIVGSPLTGIEFTLSLDWRYVNMQNSFGSEDLSTIE